MLDCKVKIPSCANVCAAISILPKVLHGVLLLCLMLCLAGCPHPSPPSIPPLLLVPTPVPVFSGSINSDLLDWSLDLRSAAQSCNSDKQAIKDLQP